MFRFKREYRPIRGQTWWEKILDIATREYPLNKIETIVCFCACFGGIAIWALRGVMDRMLSREDILLVLCGEVALVVLWYILCGIEWIGRRVERSVKSQVSGKIERYVTEKGSCTYDELMDAVIKIRIHRGFDDALEKFESDRKLAVLDGVCRVPTDEDKDRWRDDDVYWYGVAFEELEQVYAHPLEWFGGELRIEFSVWEDEVHRLEKVQDTRTNAEVYVCTVAGGGRREFSSFAELADAPLFKGKNLREVCNRICVSYANGYDWPREFFDDICSCS